MTRIGKEHFIGLEWLRFLLGVYVVVFHTLHNYPSEQKPSWLVDLTGVGFFATSSFFVLSGFLLAHVYCRQGQLREPARSFWSRRFAKTANQFVVLAAFLLKSGRKTAGTPKLLLFQLSFQLNKQGFNHV